MTSILVLGAGAYYVRALAQLKAAGLRVLVVDRDPEAPGRTIADSARAIDLSDAAAVLDWARRESIDGIMPLNDFGTPTAAIVSQALGLVGNSPASARLTNDKAMMRRRWAEAGLAIPAFAVLSRALLGTEAGAAQVAKAVHRIGYPLVVKPALTGGGGRGISVVHGEDGLDWALAFAAEQGRNDSLVLEQFIDGTELTVEMVSVDGHHSFLAASDKYKPPLKTRVATALNYPARIPQATLLAVIGLVSQALTALEHRNGISHTEVILEHPDRRPVLVETGGRPGGGHIFHTLIEAVTGINGPTLNAHVLTGAPIGAPRPLARGGVYRFFSPPYGRLRAVHHLDRACALPGVLDLGVTVKVGELVGTLPNSLRRAGYIVTAGETLDDAMAAADRAESTVVFEVERLGDTDPLVAPTCPDR